MRPFHRAAFAALVALAVSGCGSAAPAVVSARPEPVEISVSDCGSAWAPEHAGRQDLVLHNADSRPGEVQVVGRGEHRGRVYADVEPFGPGTTVRLDVPLAAGRYALACLMEDSSPVTGPTVTLTGAGRGAPGVRTVTQSRLVPAALRYTAWVRGRLPSLVADVRRLRGLVDAGDLPAARRAWESAHLDYLRLGAAYEAFGDLGDRIDGLPQGLPGGTHDRRWSGFHRVERDLWHPGAAAGARRDTARLGMAVAALPGLVRTTQLEPGTLVLRAHEIDENALQLQLTGQDDFGSHSDLAAVRSELAGTVVALHSLAALVRQHVAAPARIGHALRRARAVVGRAHARYAGVSVRRLPRDVREGVDAALALLCERLAAIPATLEPRLAATTGATGDQG